MGRRHLAGLILASALVTLDGTATTVALPSIGRDLSTSVNGLQWIVNAPLLMLAALLLPAGTLGDRYGHVRMMRTGLVIFGAALVAGAFAGSTGALIAAKFVSGVGGALVLPASLALLRSSYTDDVERTRVFGIWAAWTGGASAAGPLLAGALVSWLSWRAIFVPTIGAAVAAVLLLRGNLATSAGRRQVPIPGLAIIGLMTLIGTVAYLLMQSSALSLGGGIGRAVAVALVAAVLLAHDGHRSVLFPREIVARNCVSANASTFAFYFGMFGLSFLLVLYVQQVLNYSAIWAAVVLLPISVMLFFAEAFGRLARSVGTRWLVIAGSALAAAGIGWMGTSAHPLPFWTHIAVGTATFGLGISLAISALTHAAVAAVPEACAGAASGLNHAVVRLAGLLAVASLGAIAAPGMSNAISPDGFQRALIVCAAVVGIGGVSAGVWLRDEQPGGVRGSEST